MSLDEATVYLVSLVDRKLVYAREKLQNQLALFRVAVLKIATDGDSKSSYRSDTLSLVGLIVWESSLVTYGNHVYTCRSETPFEYVIAKLQGYHVCRTSPVINRTINPNIHFKSFTLGS